MRVILSIVVVSLAAMEARSHHTCPVEEHTARQNFPQESEIALNAQINLEKHGAYTYESMGNYFMREDVALPGFSHFFLSAVKEEREHAQWMVEYLQMRGGLWKTENVAAPATDDWSSPLVAMKAALDLEKLVNSKLITIRNEAVTNGDVQLADWIEKTFLQEQVEAAKTLSDIITRLVRVGCDGPGLMLIDQEVGRMEGHGGDGGGDTSSASPATPDATPPPCDNAS